MPITPPGTKIVARKKPSQRATWSKYGVLGRYIRPVLEHYRCYKVFFIEKISEIIADVVEFTIQNVRMPILLSADSEMLAAQYLVEALQKQTRNTLFETINDTHHTVLRSLVKLSNIITKVAEQKSANRHNRWQREVASKPYQGGASVTHQYTTIK